MTGWRYSSGDFAKVPSALEVELPSRLLHDDVLGSSDPADQAFSMERLHLVRTVDLPSQVLSMTIGGLEPGQSTRLHRHNYETVIYVLAGVGTSIIADREVAWRQGDAFYIPVWAWHRHANTSATEAARYIACENAPMLLNLGIALREEQ
jgi:quercetin dioxygenase-like cupin family protein